MTQLDIKIKCDICHEVFTTRDLADPHGVVRLNPVEGTESVRDGEIGRHWVVVGYGSGHGTIFVHAGCCAAVGEHVGNIGERREWN